MGYRADATIDAIEKLTAPGAVESLLKRRAANARSHAQLTADHTALVADLRKDAQLADVRAINRADFQRRFSLASDKLAVMRQQNERLAIESAVIERQLRGFEGAIDDDTFPENKPYQFAALREVRQLQETK